MSETRKVPPLDFGPGLPPPVSEETARAMREKIANGTLANTEGVTLAELRGSDLRLRVAHAIAERLREPFRLLHAPELPMYPPFLEAAEAALGVIRETNRREGAPSYGARYGDAEDYLTQLAHRLAHLDDLYAALGVKWGEDPFARIVELVGGTSPLIAHHAQLRILSEVIVGLRSLDPDLTSNPWRVETSIEQSAVAYAGLADERKDLGRARRYLVEVAALAVGAIEALDREHPEARELQREEANRVAHS